ncbi:unnamed protein product [Absidia cylindrospora]
MNNAKDGYFSLNLLKGLVTELKDYPVAYLQHCISYQQKHHPDQSQLELGHDESQVRIARRDGNITPVTETETDPFGFLIKHSSTTTTTTTATEDTGEKRPSSSAAELSPTPASSASETHPPLQKRQRRSSGTYFTPYRPSFNFTALAEDEAPMDLLPVLYADGKFYQDDSFFNASKAERATKTIPLYDKLEALPIGMDQVADGQTRLPIKERTCWNCGAPGHEIPKCPVPVDRQQVEINRALHLTNNGRYYEELSYKDRISGMEPGRLSASLRYALEMHHSDDEPPYYRAMRTHGYPPGYTGTYADQERVMKLVAGNQLDEDVPDLKIFDHDCDEEDDDKDKSAEQDQDSTVAPHERVRMVTYPGLYRTQEMTGYDHQTLNAKPASHHQTPYVQQGSDHRQKPYYQQEQQQYYQQTYYQQQQPPWDYGTQQQNLPQNTLQHQHQHQSFSPYSQYHPESSNYQHQPYYPNDYHGYQQTYHQIDPAYAYYYNDQQVPPYGVYNGEIPPPPVPSQSSIDDIPPPPPPPSNVMDDDIPPPPPSNDMDDDIPPPPPSNDMDDDIPPPPPSHNIDDDNPPPPPSHSIDDDIPPPPPSHNIDDDIPPPPSASIGDDIPHPSHQHRIAHDTPSPPLPPSTY